MSAHPPILRMLRIHQLIQGRRYPNVPDLARLLDVSQRTIQRDVEALRERMGAPLAFNPIENGFEYTEEFALPEAEITDGELLCLLVADPALSIYAGTEFEPVLRELLERASTILTEQRTVSPQKVADAAPPLPDTRPARIDPKLLATVNEAIRLRETIEIGYHPQKRSQRTKRRIDPYHLAFLDGEWYLLAYCHRDQKEQVFRPAHIHTAKATGRRFLPRHLDPEEFLRSRIGETGAKRIFEAVLHFEPGLAQHILEQDLGTGYRVQTLMDGGVELSFKSDNPDAVIRWCLGWGVGAEVVSPPWVRRRARQVLRQLARQYEGRIRTVRGRRSR